MKRLIDAEDLKKRYALLMWKEHNPYDTVKVCDVVNQTIDFIDNAPTVEERPQGEWEFGGFCVTTTSYKCPFCKTKTLERTKFCSECGADMREGRQ